MADLLGATNPVPGYDNSITNNRNLPLSPDSTLVQNVPDPNRVVRPDGKTEQQDSSAQDGSLIRYDSNFQTFLQRLREAPGLAAGMLRLFAGREGPVVLSGLSEGIAKELSQALEMLRMDESQMMEFITGQVRSGTRFSGALFALLRGAYNRAGSEGVRQDILQFLRSCFCLRKNHLTPCRHFSNLFQDHSVMYRLKSILPPGKRSMMFTKYCWNRHVIPMVKCLSNQTPGIFFIILKLIALKTPYAGDFPVNIVGMCCSIAGNPPSGLCPAGCPG